MKAWLFLLLTLPLLAGAGSIHSGVPESVSPESVYLIYLHGRIIENSGPRPTHPQFGRYDYPAVLEALSSRGGVVISAQRPPETDVDQYASVVIRQVETLIERGVPPGNIVVIGFSKGGAISMRVSSRLQRPQVRFVLLASCPEGRAMLQLKLTGHILSVHETSDSLAGSCKPYASQPDGPVSFKEIAISTGKMHGAFYLPRPEWANPVLDWVHGASD